CRQGRGALQEPAQGVEEGGGGPRLARGLPPRSRLSRPKLADRATRRDRFHQQAKREVFLARAVYKLSELDEKFHLLAPGDRVLDLGCAPGSWLQYARQRVGEQGVLVGLDRGPLPR